VIDIPAQPVGSLRFSCGMGMYGGQIEFVAGSASGETQTQTSSSALGNPTPPPNASVACDPSVASCKPNQGDPNFIGPVQSNQTAPATTSTQSGAAIQTVSINVSDYGYEPPVSRAKANVPIKLVLQTQGAYG